MTTQVLASEWIKLRSVRPTLSLLALTALAILGLAAFSAAGQVAARGQDPGSYSPDPLGGSLAAIGVVELLVGAFGALLVTREYRSRQVLTSFTATPQRTRVVLAKVAVAAVSVLAVALPAFVAAFLVARAVLGAGGESISLVADGVPRALLGAALYLAVVAALGAGFGWLLRSTAAALTALVLLFFGVPFGALLLPRGLSDGVVPFLPANAGTAVVQLGPSGLLPPWLGLLVLAGYAAIVVALGTLLVRRLDV